MSEIKYTKNETKDEEPLVMDNSVINVPSYFKLFECGEKLLNKLDAICERVCMATLKEKYETEFIKYQRTCMVN